MQEETISSDFLSCEELSKHSKVGKLPTFKVGEKKYFPFDPAEEHALLEDSANIRAQKITRKKVARMKDLMQAEWDAELKQAVTNQIKGKITQHMGYSLGGKFYFTPEETVFLIEIGSLELYYGKMPLSAEEAYALVLNESLSFEKYVVYSCLSRNGFIVVKHNSELNLRTAEEPDSRASEVQSLKFPNRYDREDTCVDDNMSSSSHSSSEEKEQEDLCVNVDAASPERVPIPQEESISAVSVSETIDITSTAPDGENNGDHCLDGIISEDITEDNRNSPCIPESGQDNNGSRTNFSPDYSAEHVPNAQDTESENVEVEIRFCYGNKGKIGVDDDSLESYKLVIVEPDANEIDVIGSTSGAISEPAPQDVMHANNNAINCGGDENKKETDISFQCADNSDSGTVNEVEDEGHTTDFSDSGEEINVDRASPLEKDCEEINTIEKELNEGMDSLKKELNEVTVNSEDCDEQICVDKDDELVNPVGNEAEKANSADEFIDVEQIDSSDDESPCSSIVIKSPSHEESISSIAVKEVNQISDSSGESSDRSSSVVSDSSDDSSESEDEKVDKVSEQDNSDKNAKQENNVSIILSDCQNSENASAEIEDSEILFIEVKPKESKPLAVIDLLSESDSEGESQMNELIITPDDDEVLIIGEEPRSSEQAGLSTRRHIAKKEKISDGKEREELPLEWPFPDFAGKSVVCLPRPPPHLLPPNVRPNKEVYPIDCAMFSRNNGLFEKQGFRRDWHNDRKNQSYENYSTQNYRRPYNRWFESQRTKSTSSNNYADRSNENDVREASQDDQDDNVHRRSKVKYGVQGSPQHHVQSAHYRERNANVTSSGKHQEMEFSCKRRTDWFGGGKAWEHFIVPKHRDRNISNRNTVDESSNICDRPKRRYEEQSQIVPCSPDTRSGSRSDPRWSAVLECSTGNSQFLFGKRDHDYRTATAVEHQKYNKNSYSRFSGDSSSRCNTQLPNRFLDSRFPLDLRPEVERNFHLRQDEVSSSSSPVPNKDRDRSPHGHHSYSSFPYSFLPLGHHSQRQQEASRPHQRLQGVSSCIPTWSENDRSEDGGARRGSPYTDVLNLCVQRNKHSPMIQNCIQPSTFQNREKSYTEQHDRLGNFYLLQNRSNENFRSGWSERNEIREAPMVVPVQAEREFVSSVNDQIDFPRSVENMHHDSVTTTYNNDKVQKLDAPLSGGRKVILSSTVKEVASQDCDDDVEIEVCRVGNSNESPHLPVSLLEMIESAKNTSSGQPTCDGSIPHKDHKKRKNNQEETCALNFIYNHNVMNSTDGRCDVANTYSSGPTELNSAQNDFVEVDCSEDSGYPRKRRVIMVGVSLPNTNSSVPERTLDQHTGAFMEPSNCWEDRTNFRSRDVPQRSEGEHWRDNNKRHWRYRPRHQGGSFRHRRQYHGPSKAVNYPSAIEKLPDRISSWSEYWSTLKKLEQPHRVRAEVSGASLSNEEILWSKDVQPLIRPGTQYPVADVLSSLKITQCLNIIKTENLCDRFLPRTCSMEISFDVYLPGTRFSKKSPGTPNYRIVVTRSSDPLPKFSEVVALQKKFSDQVLLQFAVLDHGELSFYSFNDVSLPILLPLHD